MKKEIAITAAGYVAAFALCHGLALQSQQALVAGMAIGVMFLFTNLVGVWIAGIVRLPRFMRAVFASFFAFMIVPSRLSIVTPSPPRVIPPSFWIEGDGDDDEENS